MDIKVPRLVIAGLAGDSGKTLVTLSLLNTLKQKALSISVFKKGPDYIDAAWLSRVSGTACRNLDTYLTDPSYVLDSFAVNSKNTDIAIIEGNRGVFDGKDIHGTHSTAQLAKLLQSPVILVVNCTKATRTIAAIVKGCVTFDNDLNIAGVVLNNVAGERHKRIITDSIEKYCNLPVLGAVPKLGEKSSLIPGRHLGLTPPTEFGATDTLENILSEMSERYLDIDGLLDKAKSAPLLSVAFKPESVHKGSGKARVGYFRDTIFTFYYPENLEMLEANGAELVPISSLDDRILPGLDALYIGGGFPETHAGRLYRNRDLMNAVKAASKDGMPIYAECGGLIYLSKSITWGNKRYDMAGIFPIELTMNKKPIGHGYTIDEIDYQNPFFETGSVIRGHEFHYSGISEELGDIDTCMNVSSGFGLDGNRDGLIYKNTLACYTHIHAGGNSQWALSMVNAAMKYKEKNSGDSGLTGSASGRNTIAA